MRELTVTVAVALTVVAVPTVASAHIDPDPPEAQAGSRHSVGFSVAHGCDGSPTVQLDVRLPDGVVDAVPEPPSGWTAAIDGDVITFVGGPHPADQELTFRLSMTLPPTPGLTLYFPFVQRCEAGEIRWIDLPDDDTVGDELEEPAPAMALFGPVVDAAEVPASETAVDVTVHDHASHDHASADDDADDGDSSMPIVIGVLAGLIVAVAAGLALARRRR